MFESLDLNSFNSLETDGYCIVETGSYGISERVPANWKINVHGPSFNSFPKRHKSDTFSKRSTHNSSTNLNVAFADADNYDNVKDTPGVQLILDNDLETDDGQLFAADLMSEVQINGPLVNQNDEVCTTRINEINNGIHNLDIAVLNNHTYFEQLTKPDSEGDTLVFIAIITRSTNLLLVMVSMIPELRMLQRTNKMFQTALHLAALTDNARAARRLVIGGVEVDQRDKFGNTALHIACKRGNLAVATKLLTPVTYLETKQNLYEIPYQKIPQCMNIRNFEGQTCLHLLTARKHAKLFDLLLSKNADINVIEMKAGKTCLHIFAENGDINMVKYLLSKPGLNVNARTFAGFTALELAHYRGHSYIVSQLLFAGANPDMKSLDTVYDDDDLDEGLGIDSIDDEVEKFDLDG